MTESNHGLVGAYAADALDVTEREHFEAHLGGCADCRAEVDSLREATATLAEAVTTVPPAALRGRVMAQIGAVRPLPPVAEEATATGPTDELAARRSRRRVTVGIAAAAAAVVAVVGVGVTQYGPEQEQLSASQRVIQADDARRASLELEDGSTVAVVHSEAVGQSVVQTEGMVPPPAGSVYQLWYAEGDEFVSAGLMPVGRSDQTVRLQGDSGDASGVGITVEPEGGSESPTSEPIAEFDFGSDT